MKLLKVILGLSVLICLSIFGYWYSEESSDVVINIESTERVNKVEIGTSTQMRSSMRTTNAILNNDDALQSLMLIIDSITNGSDVNLNDEKQLIKYLRVKNRPAIYAMIFMQLTAANSQTSQVSSIQQYLLSLLAAIKTVSSAEALLSAITTLNVNDASAIYVVRKCIVSLGRTPANLPTLQHSFAQLPVDNKFLDDIALSIAQSAQPSNLEFMLNYFIGDDGAKSNAVKNSLSTLRNERLVPTLQTCINNNDNNIIVTSCLNSLANMGQYQATSALIAWSTTQPDSATKQVEALFRTALNRSPSAFRSIEKELNLVQFSSAKIKGTILTLSNDLAVSIN